MTMVVGLTRFKIVLRSATKLFHVALRLTIGNSAAWHQLRLAICCAVQREGEDRAFIAHLGYPLAGLFD